MTSEGWAAVSVGVALAVLILGQMYYLGSRIDALGRDLRSELGGCIEALGKRLDGRIDAVGVRIDGLGADLHALCERFAKLEGLFEGFRLPWPKERPKP